MPLPDPSPDEIAARRLSRMSDEIVDLILHGEPVVDIEIAIERMRDYCTERFPGRMDLFERLYASRFRRIRDQWYPGDEERPSWT